MIIYNYGNTFDYELEKLSRLFLPFERIDVVNGEVAENDRFAITKTDFDAKGCNISASLCLSGKVEKCDLYEEKRGDFQKICQLSLASCLFECFVRITGYKPSWGILTGVRPARLFISKAQELGYENAVEFFENTLKVSDKKIKLLTETAKSEDEIISLSGDNSFSLYLSIPFCPGRCSYCSFVSHSIDRSADIIPKYIELLCSELKLTGQIARDLGLKLETVYMGGGTPTTLSANQMEKVLSSVFSNFDFKDCREFTVEAGRPDTITKEKFSVIKDFGISRISINPQTLNDNVLKEIGRGHTAQMFYDSFYLAREMGFGCINTDLIAGLPGDNFESFKNTISEIIKLSPENVTVHSLSMKRASTLTAVGFSPEIDAGIEASKMVDYARERLIDADILPYYMYRQSKTVGNLENVGYSKQGFEGLYNVFIMDETHTVLACGASAATKLKSYKTGNISRIFNFKYPYEYISRYDELMERKEKIYEFYKNL